MKKVIIILSLVVVVLGAWLFVRSLAHRDISVGYVGTTDETVFGRIAQFAVFSVTNHNDVPVRFSISSLDFKTTDGWTPVGPEIVGRCGAMTVAANARMNWRINEPETGKVWRLTISCVEGSKGNGRHYSLVIPETKP